MALAVLPDQMARLAQIGPFRPKGAVDYQGGNRDLVVHWPHPKYQAIFSTTQGLDKATYDSLLDFFWAGGDTYPFLVKIWTDYQLTDEPMVGTVGGGNDTFQLGRTRTMGGQTGFRPIWHDHGTFTYEQSGGGSLTVASDDGSMVTFTTVPTSTPQATGTFRVPMTIENDWMPAVVNWEQSAQIPNVELLEDFNPPE